MSKTFERCIHNRISKFIAKFCSLSPTLFGFREKVSTQDALIELTGYIYEVLNCKEDACAIFIDYSKASNAANHEILLEKSPFSESLFVVSFNRTNL